MSDVIIHVFKNLINLSMSIQEYYKICTKNLVDYEGRWAAMKIFLDYSFLIFIIENNLWNVSNQNRERVYIVR
jgi:hypothetical protein